MADKKENSDYIHEQSKETVGGFVEIQVAELETKYGILAQVFFAEVGNGKLGTDLAVEEFLKYQVEPLQAEIDTWLDW